MPDLINTLPCGFLSFGDDGTIVELNETLADMLGYARVELAGWHVDKIFPPGGRIFYHTYLFPMLKGQQSVDEVYLALRTRDGKDIPVLFNGVRREREGRFVSDCICVKMIQRHEFEAQLLAARRLAEEAAAAKSRFLSMMSHDLSTPLTAIYGNAQLLAVGEFGPLNEEQLESVRAITEACRMQTTLINDILDFARLDSGRVAVHARPVKAADITGRAVALLRVPAAEAGLRLTVQDCGGPTLLADPDRLQQILLNLLSNAIKFTPRGGEVAVLCDSDGGRVRIRVRDTGVGIPPDQLSNIFGAFVQLQTPPPPDDRPARARGVGLGLAISREIARAMNGDVTVESAPGQGSVFIIDLPATQPDAAAVAG